LRLKLLIVVSLVAAVVGAGVCLAVRFVLLDPPRIQADGWLAVASFVVPLVAISYAAFFLYRHTARRRGLQAASAALLTLILTLAVLLLGSTLARRPVRELVPAPIHNLTD
jgi:integral membrane sensor domain MASE1